MKRLFLILILSMTLKGVAQNNPNISINVKGLKFEMVRIKGDTFTHQNFLGDTIYHYYRLAPIDSQRAFNGFCKIKLSDFYIGKFEVTQDLYEKVMKRNPSYYKSDNTTQIPSGSYPVESVSWYDAMEFINTLNALTGMHFRLPTEMEWEYAAAGGSLISTYSGGNNHDIYAWGWDNGGQHTHPVGQKLPNGYGLYDMSGNVHEWCSDWFSPYYYQPDQLYINPTGPQQGNMKVTRGGSWGNYNKFLEYKTRVGEYPQEGSNADGFRLAMDAD